jgi:hypothetical protein
MIDIAPTVLKVLGVPIPAMDGSRFSDATLAGHTGGDSIA